MLTILIPVALALAGGLFFLMYNHPKEFDKLSRILFFVFGLIFTLGISSWATTQRVLTILDRYAVMDGTDCDKYFAHPQNGAIAAVRPVGTPAMWLIWSSLGVLLYVLVLLYLRSSKITAAKSEIGH